MRTGNTIDGDRYLEIEQFIARPRQKVFAFFSEARNLEGITPPWLSFHIAWQSDREIGEGSEFVYRLKMRGLPMTWHSRITEWVPGREFVDVQLRGPYAKWNHRHSFSDVDGGTLIRDEVVFRLPFGWLGQAIAGSFVESDIRKIFVHRKERTASLLGATRTPILSSLGPVPTSTPARALVGSW